MQHYLLADQKLPAYLNYVAEACAWQSASLDCLFFVVVHDLDADAARARPAALFPCRAADDALPANVLVRVLSWSEWAALMMRSAHVTAQPLGNYKKQSDYRPAYADLFSEFLPESRYSHWGWFDPDTIIGNVSHFMDGLELDIYTAYWPPAGPDMRYMAGQLSVFRNTAALRHLYLQIPNVVQQMDDPAQLGVDESIFGAVVFPTAERFGYRFKSSFESLQDHPNEPGHDRDDYVFERGRVFAVSKCNAGAALREAVHIHIAGIKRFPGSGGCDFVTRERGWALPRWELAATPGEDRLVPSFATFHDPEWGRRC